MSPRASGPCNEAFVAKATGQEAKGNPEPNTALIAQRIAQLIRPENEPRRGRTRREESRHGDTWALGSTAYEKKGTLPLWISENLTQKKKLRQPSASREICKTSKVKLKNWNPGGETKTATSKNTKYCKHQNTQQQRSESKKKKNHRQVGNGHRRAWRVRARRAAWSEQIFWKSRRV